MWSAERHWRRPSPSGGWTQPAAAVGVPAAFGVGRQAGQPQSVEVVKRNGAMGCGRSSRISGTPNPPTSTAPLFPLGARCFGHVGGTGVDQRARCSPLAASVAELLRPRLFARIRSMTSPASAARRQIAATPRPHRSNGGRPLPNARAPAQTAAAASPRACSHHRSSLSFVTTRSISIPPDEEPGGRSRATEGGFPAPLMSPADVKGPTGRTGGAFDLCALGRIRTCNLLIRSSMWIGRWRSYRLRYGPSWTLPGGAGCCGCCTSLLYRHLRTSSLSGRSRGVGNVGQPAGALG